MYQYSQIVGFCAKYILLHILTHCFAFIDSPLKGLGTGMVSGSKENGSQNTWLGKAAVFTAPSMELR